MKNKLLNTSLIMLLVASLLIGCSNNQKSVKDIKGENYRLTKLDLYSKLDLNTEKNEYIFINSVNNNKAYFTYEQFEKNEGTGRSKTLRIGEYDIKSSEVKFIEEFNNTMFVNDVTCNNNNEIIYACYDEQNHWYIKKLNNLEESIIDEGDNFTFMPKLVKNGSRLFYLYEKINKTEDFFEYQYGVNEILGKGEFSEIDKHKIRIKDEKEITEKEGIIDGNFYSSKNAVAYLTHKAKNPFVNVVILNTGKTKNIEIDGKIHNVNLLKDEVLMSLEDTKTGKIKLEALDYSSGNVAKSDVNFPLYRMESNGNDKVLAIDESFNIYLVDIYNNSIGLKNIDVEGHVQEPVLFEKISEKEFLIHYGNQGMKKKEIYLLTIR